MKSQIEPAVYQAARGAAVFGDRSELGILKISGESRLDLIHRMSTQDVKGLKSGEGAATVLTTDIGRIIDRLIIYASSKAVYALTSEKNADNIARYLMRFVFFQDDFHLEDLSAKTAVLAVYGPQAGKILAAAGLPGDDLPLHHWRQIKMAQLVGGTAVTVYLHRTDPIVGGGYFVMCPAMEKASLQDHLLANGIVAADEAALDFLRIEAGLPRFGRELTRDYIPLEANLWDDVSFNKGCYTGQEIIARMESQGKLAKMLVKLLPEAPVDSGTELTAQGKKVGSVTSSAVGPNGPVALGFVKTAVLDDGGPFLAGETAVALADQP